MSHSEHLSSDKLVTKITRYEEGRMLEEEMVDFFQYLIDTNLAWKLQGHYGRMAARMIDAGFCKPIS
jgi:hypothetical protein